MGGEQHKGHVFDFNYDRCKRCGMTKSQWENAGEPPCTGQKVEPADEQPTTHGRFVRGDFE